jgi:hypothetical protein
MSKDITKDYIPIGKIYILKHILKTFEDLTNVFSIQIKNKFTEAIKDVINNDLTTPQILSYDGNIIVFKTINNKHDCINTHKQHLINYCLNISDYTESPLIVIERIPRNIRCKGNKEKILLAYNKDYKITESYILYLLVIFTVVIKLSYLEKY